MANIDLTKYGITGTTEIVYNPSYETLFAEETKEGLTGYEVGKVTELDTVNVMTGIFTGRSPKDKYIVMDENSKDTVWWTTDEYKNDNHPMTEATWAVVKDIAQKELSNKRLFVVDAFCGANKDTRMAIRFIVEVAWQAHFVKNISNLTSLSTTLPRLRSRTSQSSASTLRHALHSTSHPVSRLSSTHGTAER